MKKSKNLKILAVDDSVTNIFLLEGILEEEGYQTLSAANGEEALNIIKNDPPDLVLLDLMMPKLNGYKFLEEIKQIEEAAKIPIIVVSAKTDVEDIKKATSLGAVDYIKKPVNIQNLIDKVDFVLEQQLKMDKDYEKI